MAPQREWFEKDYYKVLGVPENATEKEIGRAYRKLAKQYHPDANPAGADRFKEVSAAYEVLGDPAKRKEYDEVRRMGVGANPFAATGGAARSGFGAGLHVDDLGDLLGSIFGRASRVGRPGSGSSQRGVGVAQRGADLEAELHLSFAEAVGGLTTTVNVTSEVPCRTCSGSGLAPGSAPVVCNVCSGRGVFQDNQGMFSFSQPCAACGGTGFRVEKPCPSCGGTGTQRAARQVKVRIPAGVEDGQRIRVKGRGGQGRAGGPPGDLYVVVRVDPHRLFGRRGKDLTLEVPITFPEAALGATITVPTLDRPVTLKIPPGTPSGRTFRVRGRGVPLSSGAGDLLVTVNVAVPEHLSETERQAVETLADSMKGDVLRGYLWGEP